MTVQLRVAFKEFTFGHCVRRKLWHEQTVAKLPAGVLARIKLVLRPGESQAQFIASAIIKAVERRERSRKRK